jgi:xylulokinase
VDVGTSATRVSLVRPGGHAVVASAGYRTVRTGAGRAAGLFGVPGSCAPAPLLYGPTQSSGASVAWVARLLGCRPADVPVLAAQASAGPWPAFVPYLSGERAPLWNADARGLLLGLAAEHGRPRSPGRY